MRWEDESYVRWYRRNTPEWCLMTWQARGLFGLIMREVDRAGILELGRLGLKAVAVVVRAPWGEIEALLQELIDDGCVVYRDDLRVLLIPNFIAAQEANASDRARQRASRERARDLARAKSLHVLDVSRSVAIASPAVTKEPLDPVNGHSDLSLDKQNQTKPAGGGVTDETTPEAQRPDPPEPAKAESPYDMATRIYAEHFRKTYRREFMLTSFGHRGTDEWALVEIGRLAASKGDPERWLRHWCREYLRDEDKYLVKNAHAPRLMAGQLNKYGDPKKPKVVTPPKPEPTPEPARPFTPLPKVNGPAHVHKASTHDELKAKAEADKARLLAVEGKS